MVWRCLLWDGPGFATKIEGRMDAELYTAILEDELQQTMEWYGLETEDVIFQQDNEPKHTSKKARKWFNEHGYQVLQWPAQSPDLNPIATRLDSVRKVYNIEIVHGNSPR
jgi:hypothetical protein